MEQGVVTLSGIIYNLYEAGIDIFAPLFATDRFPSKGWSFVLTTLFYERIILRQMWMLRS
jgi:hypothetical protein